MSRAIAIAILLVAGVASAEPPEVGDTARVPRWQWVTIRNLNGAYGETCGIVPGEYVTVMAVDGPDSLVRYRTFEDDAGTRCATGVLFFLPNREFSRMTADYEAKQAAEKAMKGRVKRLLGWAK